MIVIDFCLQNGAQNLRCAAVAPLPGPTSSKDRSKMASRRHCSCFGDPFCKLLVSILKVFGYSINKAIGSAAAIGFVIALFGAIGFLIGPYGPFSLLPERVLNTWMQLPTPLLTLVFATLMLGRPIPRISGLWKPVASQALLGLLLGFGQYVVGGIIVLSFLLPYLGVDPLMG